ncbi:hypothetical protein LMG28688_02530 [Paraburkholderia caffeinitolerans]|uniref:Outer membrane protein beta-barrel domain-containing protein n=2 Tax=Burkholderiaceae TaxID=119060 RepID=A0A6J5FYT2_9BURK|nr:hypothetical protein LMG28688_02530 [Paraburkholderia caffeinitolerans]
MSRTANLIAACLIGGVCAPAFAADVAPANPASVNPATADSLPAAPAPAPIDAGTGWQFAITPYLWLPNVGGTMRFTLPGGGADASTGPYNYLENLRFAMFLQGEARKGEWSVFGDMIFLKFGQHRSNVNTFSNSLGSAGTQSDFETSLKGQLIQVGGGRTVVQRPWGNIDAIVGMRYLGVQETLDGGASGDVNGGSGVGTSIHVSPSQDIFDGFAGVRGRVSLSSDGRWFVPYYLDIGAGTSRFTWQASGGVGYAWKWGDASLTYRYLAFYGSGDQLVQTLRFNGPSANVTFRF